MKGSTYSFAAIAEQDVEVPSDSFAAQIKKTMAKFIDKFHQPAQVCIVSDRDFAADQVEALEKSISLPVRIRTYIPARNYWLGFDLGEVEREEKQPKEI